MDAMIIGWREVAQKYWIHPVFFFADCDTAVVASPAAMIRGQSNFINTILASLDQNRSQHIVIEVITHVAARRRYNFSIANFHAIIRGILPGKKVVQAAIFLYGPVPYPRIGLNMQRTTKLCDCQCCHLRRSEGSVPSILKFGEVSNDCINDYIVRTEQS